MNPGTGLPLVVDRVCEVVTLLVIGLVLFVAWILVKEWWNSLCQDAAEYRAIRATSKELEALFAQGHQAVVNRLNQR